MNEPEPSLFEHHQLVRKVTGDYKFLGRVVSSFLTLAGRRRYVVDQDGLLHIFAGKNLVAHAPPEKDLPTLEEIQKIYRQNS